MLIFIVILLVLLFIFFGQNETNNIKAPKNQNTLLKNHNLKYLGNFTNHYNFNVAGVNNYIYEIFNFCKNQDSVFLISEPDNKFDSDAIKVMCNNLLIGYVPAVETSEVSEILNKEYFAYIEKLDKDPGWINISIKILH